MLALKSGAAQRGRPLNVEHRDLYRRPYDRKELAAFDAVVLDPPRAGAQEQVRVVGTEAAIRSAIGRGVQRASGLRERLREALEDS